MRPPHGARGSGRKISRVRDRRPLISGFRRGHNSGASMSATAEEGVSSRCYSGTRRSTPRRAKPLLQHGLPTSNSSGYGILLLGRRLNSNITFRCQIRAAAEA